jgi:hypothetical protein
LQSASLPAERVSDSIEVDRRRVPIGDDPAAKRHAMEKDTWTWLAGATAFCGILAVVGWAFAIYAAVETSQIHEIIFTTDNGHKLTQSKLVYLFVLPAGQTAWCLLLPAVIRWKHYFQKLREKWAPFNERIPLPIYIKLYTVGVSIFACVVLDRSVVRSLGLIHMW